MVYAENPYVEVAPIRENVYGLLEENADDEGQIWMYLIVGPRKALLIDTSFGIGDLKGLCDTISGGKPLVVVNTHSHPDHSYGNCRFDAVYCHPFCIPELEMHQKHMWDRLMDENGKGIWMNFTRSDLPVFQKYQLLECPDGTVFHLGGGLEIEAIHTPGHHSGHICLLDRKHRLLFAGDSICSQDIHVEGPWPGQSYPEYSTLWAYREGMQRLALRTGEFDEIYPSHHSCGLKNTVIRSILNSCGEIITNPSSFDRAEVCQGQKQYFKRVEGLGNIVYRVVCPPCCAGIS